MVKPLKLIRIIVFVLIVLVAVRIWRETTSIINNLLSFQVTLYSYVLSAQQAAGSVTDTIGSVRQQAQQMLWAKTEISPESVPVWPSMDERLIEYAQRIYRFALLIGVIVGTIAYKIISTAVFWLRTHLNNIVSFIK